MSISHCDQIAATVAQQELGTTSAAEQLIDYARRMAEMVQQAAESGATLDCVERQLWSDVLKIGYLALGMFLKAQGNGDQGPVVKAEAGLDLLRSEQPQKRTLRTVFGEFEFSQFVYTRSTNRKHDLRPIDARLGLSDRRFSYLLEEFSLMFSVESAFGLAARNMGKVFGGKFSVDTLESVSNSAGQQAESFLASLPTPPAEQERKILVATADGKGVPLVRPDAEKVKAFETSKTHPGNRRMATLSAVYSIDPYVRTAEQIVAALFRDKREEPTEPRPVPSFKHVAAHFARTFVLDDESFTSTGPIEAGAWLGQEVDRRRQAHQRLLLLMDGDHRMWDTVKEFLPPDVIEILDILHVSKYVWDAAKVFTKSPQEREKFARQRLTTILRGGVQKVVRGFRLMATARGLKGEGLKTVTKACAYFSKHASRMRYDEYLANGYPIATGVIEGACRHLVKDRMERSGMRWKLTGAQAMLNIRAVSQSSYWKQFHEARISHERESLHPYRKLIDYAKPSEFLAC